MSPRPTGAGGRLPLRLAALVVAVAGLVIAGAGPASAHAGGPEPGDWVSTVESVSPAIPGVSVRVVDFGAAVELDNRSGVPVTVLGYDGEPYLRVGADGVEENARSATASPHSAGDSHGAVPGPAAGPAPTPQWRRISAEPRWRWHDHRTHWAAALPPSVVDRPDGVDTVEVSRYRLDFRYGQTPVQVTGRLLWVAPPPAWPWVVGAVALLGAGVAVGRLRRWRAPAAVLLAGLLLVDIAHAVADRSVAGAVPSAVGWVLGGLTLGGLARGRPWAPYPLALTAAILAVVDGIGDVSVLAHSQVPGAGPAWLGRLAATVALGLGAGLVATGWQAWRRDHPLPVAAAVPLSPSPAGSPAGPAAGSPAGPSAGPPARG